MYTKLLSAHKLRPALHLLFAIGLLLGLWAAGNAHAQQKKDLIEMPEIKKFKEEKAAAAAAEAEAGASSKTSVKHAPEKPTAKAEAVAPSTAHKQEAEAPAAKEKVAASAAHKSAPEKSTATEPEAPAAKGPAASESVKQLRQALGAIGTPAKRSSEKAPAHGHIKTSDAHGAASGYETSREYIRARALALARGEPLPDAHGKEGHGGEVHWAYEGENGPQAWGKLKPEFNLCAIGKRQSPIAIKEDTTLLGPSVPVQFHYTPSTGSVVNNGHTIQVNVEGDNSITVRNSTYKLLQFHFHTPSEEVINNKRYAMVAHLVHKNDAGQLAVVAVLLEQGEPNRLVNTVWTYMPLDTNDQVRMPEGVIDMNELLPADQRYYQYFGSLTTPPCTEGVLWTVLKQPLRISPEQFKIFSQLFPFNVRPVQAVNDRPVREAQ
jgi:carbonic anhydrase